MCKQRSYITTTDSETSRSTEIFFSFCVCQQQMVKIGVPIYLKNDVISEYATQLIL